MPARNGYSSSLKEDAERCTHCAGKGLVVPEVASLGGPGANGRAGDGERRD